jgi:uncharacterized protein YebE (UPF0316 family)
MSLPLTFLDTPLFTYALLPIFIFLARLCDVSLGTIRVIFVSRGMKYLAPLVGFVEILIWLVAMRQIFQNLSDPFCYLAYAAGFASGIFAGITIEDRLAMGVSMVRVICPCQDYDLAEQLKNAGYGLTMIDAKGIFQPVKILFSIVKRRDLKRFVGLIKQYSPHAVYTIQDVRMVSPGHLPSLNPICTPNEKP